MNLFFRTAWRAIWLSLCLVIVLATVVISEGISPETRTAFRSVPTVRPAQASTLLAAANAAPITSAHVRRPAVRSTRPASRTRGPATSVPGGIELQPRLETDDDPPAVPAPRGALFHVIPDEPPSPSTASPGVLQDKTRLARIEQQLARLLERQPEPQASRVRQTSQLLAQLQQESQLQQLERELQNLQGGSGDPSTQQLQLLKSLLNSQTAPSPAPAPAAVRGPAPKPPEPAPAEPAPAEAAPSGPEPEAVLKIEPSAPGSERFSLHVKDADIAQVLEMLGQLSGLNILATRNVVGKVAANLHDVTIDQALQAILKSGGYDFEQDGEFIFVSTAEEALARKQLARKLITKVYRPNYISVKDLYALLKDMVTIGVGKIAVTAPSLSGLAPTAIVAGGDQLTQQDALLVQDYPEVIVEIDRVIENMDVPPTQVVIEAMILSVKLTDTMEFGVNFALLNGPNNQLVVSGNGAALATGSGFPGTSGAEIVPPLGQFVQNTAGLKYGIIRGDLSGFISALETLADTNLIATPQLMVLNKQKAELIIGNRLSYSTAVFNGTQSIQNVNFIEAGTKLILRPFIAPDGLVRMEVHPERSAAVIDSKTGLPNLTTTEVTTNVMVRDGTTVVIGGLIEETASDSQSRIPLFGALPWVGPLFRNKSERTDRTELIVLITPRIVQEPLAAAEGESARFENERRAEHFRDSLTPINRRNLTRIHTERARYYFERGELEKARRQIAAAVLQNPNDRQALRLRDQIDAAIANRNRQWVRLPGFSRGPAPVPVESEPPIEQLPPPNQTANQPSPP